MQVTAEECQGCHISSVSAIAHIAAQRRDGESMIASRLAGRTGQVDMKDFAGIKPPSSDFAWMQDVADFSWHSLRRHLDTWDHA
jgi:hypothetical protein